MDQQHSSSASPFGAMSPMQMFVFGIVAGVLALCTIGFFILLGIVLKGGGLTAAAGSGTQIAANNQPPTAPNQPDPNAAAVNLPAVDEKQDHIRGSKNAKVTLVEYSDFECPFCSRFYPTVKQVQQEYGDKVRFVYRHFPLSFHPQAQPAAEASECASEQGKFWEFHDGIFENQERIGDALYKELAGKAGLNQKKFDDCVASGKFRQKITDQQNGGALAGVGGTPHTFVVGSGGQIVPVSGALPFEQIKATIDSVLN